MFSGLFMLEYRYSKEQNEEDEENASCFMECKRASCLYQ